MNGLYKSCLICHQLVRVEAIHCTACGQRCLAAGSDRSEVTGQQGSPDGSYVAGYPAFAEKHSRGEDQPVWILPALLLCAGLVIFSVIILTAVIAASTSARQYQQPAVYNLQPTAVIRSQASPVIYVAPAPIIHIDPAPPIDPVPPVQVISTVVRVEPPPVIHMEPVRIIRAEPALVRPWVQSQTVAPQLPPSARFIQTAPNIHIPVPMPPVYLSVPGQPSNTIPTTPSYGSPAEPGNGSLANPFTNPSLPGRPTSGGPPAPRSGSPAQALPSPDNSHEQWPTFSRDPHYVST